MNYKNLMLTTSFLTLITACASNNESHNEDLLSTEPSAVQLNKDFQEPVELREEVAHESAVMEDAIDSYEPYPHTLPAVQAMPMVQKAKKAERLASAPAYIAGQAVASTASTRHYYQDEGRENYAQLEQSGVKQVSQEPVSTFSIDVDTGSYTNVRRMLRQGSLPPVNAVRVEEMINYFDYAYETPHSTDEPFSVHTELALSPWSTDHALLKVGLKGYEPPAQERPDSNLVFLLDVSGSMNSPDKLPLLKKSLILLSKQLDKNDTVSIVVYAGASGVVLEPTAGNETFKIEAALNKLSAGGSTNGQAGIKQAYQLVKQNYDAEGINRVILATDGDFNVGISNVDQLKQLIETKRKEGISLTTLGFGTGNYNDHLMEQLADVGNGNYAYIDSFNEARKVLVEQLDSTLMTIAKDVKIQIEFNPAVVKHYRLLGYENRALAREDFNNDKVDAGEIGAGHTVTAIYELVLNTSDYSAVDPLRYQSENGMTKAISQDMSNELAFVKFRYKAPKAEKSKLITKPVYRPEQLASFDHASPEFRFSASVAQFGEALRNSKYVKADYESIIANSLQAKGTDPMGYRSEFIQLVRLAAGLSQG